MRSPYILSPVVPGESEMAMSAESPAGGSTFDESVASLEGGAGMGAGSPGMVSSSEPDRLLLCVSDGTGLRPWEFQADEARRHMLFSLVRSRETGSLREKLAFEPVKLEATADLIKESVQAWSKQLKIDAEGTNSVGMEMVLVPSADYHLVDLPKLAVLRRQLPESDTDSSNSDIAAESRPPEPYSSTNYKFVSYPFVMSRNPVSIQQFQRFISETNYVTDAERGSSTQADVAVLKGGWDRKDNHFEWVNEKDWRNPMAADDGELDSPVSVVSWSDATEFCKWLTEKEGRQYRLPKNDEWTAAMQLGVARKPLPTTKTDDPTLQDYRGWFDAKISHPLGIARSNGLFAEWTQDAHYGNQPDQRVLVHHEVSADGLRFYSGVQFAADQSFRAVDIGFRVVAELQALAVEKSGEEPSDSPRAEPPSDFQ